MSGQSWVDCKVCKLTLNYVANNTQFTQLSRSIPRLNSVLLRQCRFITRISLTITVKTPDGK